MTAFTYTASRQSRGPGDRAAETLERLIDYLLEQGDPGLRQLQRDQAGKEQLRHLVEQGYLETAAGQELQLTPRLLRLIENQALRELLPLVEGRSAGQHQSRQGPHGDELGDGFRPHQPGDMLRDLDVCQTVRRALTRQGGLRPVSLRAEDLVLQEREAAVGCATVLLLDMSGSMARYGKFTRARLAALGLRALIRSRFPRDTVEVAGFASLAAPLRGPQLLRATPRSVSLYDGRLMGKFSLDDLPATIPEHFTNIQAGLSLARRWLARQGTVGKQVLCITDGEPTAHMEDGQLILAFPPGEATVRCTLEELRRRVGAGIQVRFVGLLEDARVTGLQNCLDRLARAAGGVPVYCTTGQLGQVVLNRFASGRRSLFQVS